MSSTAYQKFSIMNQSTFLDINYKMTILMYQNSLRTHLCCVFMCHSISKCCFTQGRIQVWADLARPCHLSFLTAKSCKFKLFWGYISQFHPNFNTWPPLFLQILDSALILPSATMLKNWNKRNNGWESTLLLTDWVGYIFWKKVEMRPNWVNFQFIA